MKGFIGEIKLTTPTKFKNENTTTRCLYIYICSITYNINNLKRREMIEKTTEEILNAVKELIAHDSTISSLKVLIEKKLEDVYNYGHEDGYIKCKDELNG